jgi:hypothetical protein
MDIQTIVAYGPTVVAILVVVAAVWKGWRVLEIRSKGGNAYEIDLQDTGNHR